MRPPGKELLVRVLLVAALPVIVLASFAIAASHFRYTPDDTYIYLQFARNLLRGGGIAFNAGHPTYGVTGPLWMFIIASGGLFGADLAMTAKIVDLVFACAAVFVFSFLAFEVIRDRVVALAATAAFALDAWFLRWAGSGMETSLAVLLVLTAVGFCLRNDYSLASVMAGLLSLVRPEAVLLLVLITGDVFLNTADRARALTLSAAVVLTYCVVVVPWLVYSALTFGSIVPNTALAKAGFSVSASNAASTLFDIGRTVCATEGVALVALLAAGGLMLLRRKAWSAETEHPDEYRVYLLRQGLVGLGWVLVLVLLYGLIGVTVISWYVLLVTPFIILYAFFFLDRVMVHRRAFTLRYAAAFVLVLGIMAQNHVLYHRVVSPGIDEFSRGMEDCFIPIGKWFHENTSPGTVIFASDIGALGYFSDREVRDGAGLVSPEMLPFVRRGYSFGRMVAERLYRLDPAIAYVVHRSFEPGGPRMDADLVPLFSRVMPRMKLAETRYYTVCRVTSEE